LRENGRQLRFDDPRDIACGARLSVNGSALIGKTLIDRIIGSC
jgi:hypothetical protein